MANSPYKSLMPHPVSRKRARRNATNKALVYAGSTFAAMCILALGVLSLPSVIAHDTKVAMQEAPKPSFPITVDPTTRTIIEDPEVEALLAENPGHLQASVGSATYLFNRLASFIAELPAYKMLAGSAGAGLVTIHAGYRQEEVAAAFARALGWNNTERAVFLRQLKVAAPIMTEGQFVPGTYAVRGLMTPGDVQIMLSERFKHDILARYSTSTESILPIDDALTIASLLERETRDPTEMRFISGIIWNRLWVGMNLQIDATLQYARANTDDSVKTWWPVPVPKDKYIKSPYNTYMHKGLPPGPIANPSMAAVLAALNPKNTDCLFYFHDDNGDFHCTATYKEHVALLKQYYGQGK